MGEWERAPASASRRLRRVSAAVGALALVGLSAAFVGLARDGSGDRVAAGHDDRLRVERDAAPQQDPQAPWPGEADEARGRADAAGPSSEPPEPAPVGHWRELAESPLPPGHVAASAWTGTELLVWQGDRLWRTEGEADELAAYDPARDTWRTIPGVSIRAGPSTGTVWTGTELIVLGALGTDSDGSWYDDSVAYRPDTDTWRVIPAPPDGNWVWEAAVWNGSHVVVVGSTVAPAGESRPAAVGYDPARDAWEALPEPPVWSQGGRLQAVALSEVVVVVGETPAESWDDAERALTAYDPATGEWADPEPTPFQGLWSVGIAAMPDAGQVALVGAVLDGTWRDLTGVWSPGHGVHWGALAPRRAWGQRHPDLIATDVGLVSWAPEDERGWLLDEHERAWRPLARLPLPSRRHMALAWTGEELLVWGGTSSQFLFDDGAAWRPEEVPRNPPGDS